MKIEQRFKSIVDSLKLDSNINEMIQYSLFPTGKLFRPKLTLAIAKDLKIQNKDLDFLALAIEVHHTYTLIHDDLPCMDDDNQRRGRNSLHIEFNEWKALLAGDALLNLSYELIAHIRTEHLAKLLKTFASYTGANGLILGQFLDLSDSIKTYEETLELHKLKTSRLIQFSIIAPLIITGRKDTEGFDKFGEKLGLYFQVQDDLSELSEGIDKNSHEQSINLFLNFEKEKCLQLYFQLKDYILKFLNDNQLTETLKIFQSYQEKMDEILDRNRRYLKERFQISLPIK